MKVAIYCRVSTEKQDVDQQALYCQNWARKQGHVVEWTVKDKQSGRLPLTERPRFIKFINNEYNFNYDGILVYNLDRLTRNWDDVTMIEGYFRNNWNKCKLISCSDSIDLSNASGRLMFRIKMATNCFMPEDMREKQKIGIARAKKEGKFKGRPRSNVGTQKQKI